MTSSHKKIIRGVDVDGVVFCTPVGGMDSENPVERQEKENLKTLEEFWYNKGLEEGKKAGFDQGREKGQQEGHRKGFQEGEEKGKKEGLDEGQEAGIKEGNEAAHAELSDAIALVKSCADNLKDQQEALYDSAKPEIIKFSLSVCEAILRQQLADPKALSEMMERVLAQARPILKDAVADVFFAPNDLEMLRGKEQFLQADSDVAKKVNFIADDSVQPGGCRIETPLGLVNFDVKRMLLDLEKKVMEVRVDDQLLPESADATPSFANDDEVASETSEAVEQS